MPVALAEKERRLIGQRTREALAELKAQGKKLGGLRPKTALRMKEADERAEALRPVFSSCPTSRPTPSPASSTHARSRRRAASRGLR